MVRVLTFAYGIFCYAMFFAVFVYGIGFIGGFVTPTRLDGPLTRPLAEALAINLGDVVRAGFFKRCNFYAPALPILPCGFKVALHR